MKLRYLLMILIASALAITLAVILKQVSKSNVPSKVSPSASTPALSKTSTNAKENMWVLMDKMHQPNHPNTLNQSSPKIENASWMTDEMTAIQSQATNLNKDVLKTSLTAYEHAEEKGITKNPLITIVDYSKPSTQKRLWVVDVNKKQVLFNTWVSHGKNSGNVTSNSFSNRPESLKSSIGVFVTDNDIYSGKHGNSLRVKGLEPGVNDNAYKRSIVFHGAQYVSASIANSGRLGRSWGCWAVSPDTIGPLVKTIKNKSLVIAYYPDQRWLKTSSFLN